MAVRSVTPVWTFALSGSLQAAVAAADARDGGRPHGPIAEGVDRVRIGDNNVEYSYCRRACG